MKRTQPAFILAFVLVGFCLKAQDEILRTNGRSYAANILHKDDCIIKFQKYQERDQRIHIMPVSKIYALKYANSHAVKMDGTSMSEEMFAYEKIAVFNRQHLKKGIALTSAGCVAVSGGVALIIWGDYGIKESNKYPASASYFPIGEIMALFGGAVITAGFLPSIIIGARKIHISKANLRKAGAKPVTMSFNPMMVPAINQSGGLTDFVAGVGVGIRF